MSSPGGHTAPYPIPVLCSVNGNRWKYAKRKSCFVSQQHVGHMQQLLTVEISQLIIPSVFTVCQKDKV